MSAAAFAISYLPWLAGGPVLAALADRYSYRKVMIFCDLSRMALVALVALPAIPVWAMFVLVFATALLGPPFDAARSALTPQVLSGDRYVLGLGVQNSALQTSQILGYLAGSTLAQFNTHLALGINALSFGVSAALIAACVKKRPGVGDARRRHILRETGEGIQVVFGRPELRSIALMAFLTVTFVAIPEGLSAGWAAALLLDGSAQGLIMAAAPVGMALGGILMPRLLAPATRRRMLRPLVALAPLALVPALFEPPLAVVIGMIAVAGFACGSFLPIANGLFVQAVPGTHRARAFGVLAAGTQLTQGAALLATGAVTGIFGVSTGIGVWAVGGLVLLCVVFTRTASISEEPAAQDPDAKLAE
ncbi:MAG: MFS transporter [Longispora sp.]|nr:MFS transporter [Longispora sp. (in: high G+C Gram-positive bacteria)]